MKSVSDTKFVLFQTADTSGRSLFGCFSVLAVPGRLFLVVAALTWCSSAAAGAAPVDRPVRIQTYPGETVLLPCQISVSDGDGDVPLSVEWSKEGLNPKVAFVYRGGWEIHEEKNPDFRYRTNLIMNELKNGNISLRLSDVLLSDAGKYKCKIIQKPPRVVATVELVVVAVSVSEPELSVIPAVDGGLTLQCEAACWFPKPSITFLDAQRNVIVAGDTKTNRDSSRACFTAKRRLTVQTADRVTCRVDQDETNQTRVTGIYIPGDCVRSCSPSISISVIVTIILCAVLSLLFTCLLKKYCNSADEYKLPPRQSSVQSLTCSITDGHNPVASTEQAIQTATAELQREIAELKSNLSDKEEIIRRQAEELNGLRAKLSPVVIQHGQPVFASSPSKSSPVVPESINLPREDIPHNNRPKPTASSKNNHPKSGNVPQNKDSRPGPQIHETSVGRSRSMTESRSRPKGTKPERRYTITGSNNRFAVLEKLPEEDSAPLL